MLHLELKSLKKKKGNIVENKYIPHLKCGRHVGVKDKNPRKQKLQ
jgi:hypothetical protein